MKQYLDQQQTAKLIDLGFEKTKIVTDISWQENEKDNPIINANTIEYTRHYSVGELLSFLPTRTYSGSIYIDYNGLWRVGYENTVRHQSEFELIDALYFMCVRLKEEGVI